MSNRKNEKRKWFLNRLKKRMRQLSRRKMNHYTSAKASQSDKKRKKKTVTIKLPENFSLSDNKHGTLLFFAKAFSEIDNTVKRSHIYFDLSDVKNATVDAIMYFIAMINNVRRLKVLSINCSGNMPISDQARSVFEKVGFYKYVTLSNFVSTTNDPDRLKIIQGKEIDGIVASNICDFVNSKISTPSITETKRLYSVLIELMSNVIQHAYREEKGHMFPQWYIYVENCLEEIRFIFLDTGVGIPKTIRKNFFERIKEFIGNDKDDSYFIEAALKGEFRTETKLTHRGKGLPEIYDAIISDSNRLENLLILSGHGECKVDRDNSDIIKSYVECNLEGSMFMWIFKKEMNK